MLDPVDPLRPIESVADPVRAESFAEEPEPPVPVVEPIPPPEVPVVSRVSMLSRAEPVPVARVPVVEVPVPVDVRPALSSLQAARLNTPAATIPATTHFFKRNLVIFQPFPRCEYARFRAVTY